MVLQFVRDNPLPLGFRGYLLILSLDVFDLRITTTTTSKITRTMMNSCVLLAQALFRGSKIECSVN